MNALRKDRMRHLLVIGFLIISSSAFAKGRYVLSIQELQALLGDYPTHGSSAETADFNELHRLQDTRTQEECAEAIAEGDVTLENMFAGPQGPLKTKDLKRVPTAVLLSYQAAFVNIGTAKKFWQRPRPYLTDATLHPCAPLEKSFAYPSGHTAMSRAYAHMLSKIFPDKEEALFARADEIAHHRVLGGVHHPSDIVAGKKLGDAIAQGVEE